MTEELTVKEQRELARQKKIEDNELKEKYRSYFLSIKPFFNFSPLYKEVDIQQGNFSRFLNGTNSSMKIESLEKAKQYCETVVVEMLNASQLLKS